ncbi:hypothetical protein Dimus_038983 [Dionaea muscipula]
MSGEIILFLDFVLIHVVIYWTHDIFGVYFKSRDLKTLVHTWTHTLFLFLFLSFPFPFPFPFPFLFFFFSPASPDSPFPPSLPLFYVFPVSTDDGERRGGDADDDDEVAAWWLGVGRVIDGEGVRIGAEREDEIRRVRWISGEISADWSLIRRR